MSTPITSVFSSVRRRAAKVDATLRSIELRFCKEARDEHKARDRQYAHFNHHKDTICVAPEIEALEDPWKWGLMGHEFGHALAFRLVGEKHSEADANRYGGKILGTPVIYRGPQRLEWARIPRGVA